MELNEIADKHIIEAGSTQERRSLWLIKEELIADIKAWAAGKVPEKMEFAIPTIGYFGEKPACVKIAEAKNIGVEACVAKTLDNIQKG